MHKLLITLVLSTLGFWSIEAQKSFSLEEAVAYAQENADQVKMDRLKMRDADAQIDEYLAIGIPKINAGVNYQHSIKIPTQILPDFISPAVYNVLFDEGLLEDRPINFGGGIPAQFGVKNTLDVGVELQTLILDGSYFVGLRAQKLYKELVKYDHNTVLTNVKGDITKAYLTTLNIQENISLLENNISNLEKLHHDTKAIYESGFAEKLDVDRLQLSMSNLKVEKNNLERLYEVAVLGLKFNMGYPIKEPIVLTSEFDELANLAMIENISELPEVNLQDRTETKSLETAVQLQSLNVKRLRYGYFPTLTGFVNYGQTLQRNDLFDKNDNDWFPRSVVGVNLAIPIFDGFEKRAKIARAKIDQEKTLLQKSLFDQSVELEVNSKYVSYINAKEKLNATNETLDLANTIYETTKIKFKEGVGSSIELTQAESELYKAQTNYSSAQYELITTLTELKIALGKL